MKKIIAFGASSSKNSINKKLASYAASQLQNVDRETLDLNDYEIALFSEDKEKDLGQPQAALDFLSKISSADALIISFAEHNGSYTAAYKNLFDWCSRITRDVFGNKPALFLSTSPGKGGAANVLKQALVSAPHFAADIRGSLSIPSFHENFDQETNTLRAVEKKEQLDHALANLLNDN